MCAYGEVSVCEGWGCVLMRCENESQVVESVGGGCDSQAEGLSYLLYKAVDMRSRLSLAD